MRCGAGRGVEEVNGKVVTEAVEGCIVVGSSASAMVVSVFGSDIVGPRSSDLVSCTFAGLWLVGGIVGLCVSSSGGDGMGSNVVGNGVGRFVGTNIAVVGGMNKNLVGATRKLEYMKLKK